MVAFHIILDEVITEIGEKSSRMPYGTIVFSTSAASALKK